MRARWVGLDVHERAGIGRGKRACFALGIDTFGTVYAALIVWGLFVCMRDDPLIKDVPLIGWRSDKEFRSC